MDDDTRPKRQGKPPAPDCGHDVPTGGIRLPGGVDTGMVFPTVVRLRRAGYGRVPARLLAALVASDNIQSLMNRAMEVGEDRVEWEHSAYKAAWRTLHTFQGQLWEVLRPFILDDARTVRPRRRRAKAAQPGHPSAIVGQQVRPDSTPQPGHPGRPAA